MARYSFIAEAAPLHPQRLHPPTLLLPLPTHKILANSEQNLLLILTYLYLYLHFFFINAHTFCILLIHIFYFITFDIGLYMYRFIHIQLISN